MENLLETLHTTIPLTNADMFSVFMLGMMLGIFISDGFHAFIEFIVKKVRDKKNDK